MGYNCYQENLIPPTEPLMSLNSENNITPLTLNQINTPENLSTPMIDVNEMIFTKKYFIKENLILYLIYWIIFIFYSCYVLCVRGVTEQYITLGGIILLCILI